MITKMRNGRLPELARTAAGGLGAIGLVFGRATAPAWAQTYTMTIAHFSGLCFKTVVIVSPGTFGSAASTVSSQPKALSIKSSANRSLFVTMSTSP